MLLFECGVLVEGNEVRVALDLTGYEKQTYTVILIVSHRESNVSVRLENYQDKIQAYRLIEQSLIKSTEELPGLLYWLIEQCEGLETSKAYREYKTKAGRADLFITREFAGLFPLLVKEEVAV